MTDDSLIPLIKLICIMSILLNFLMLTAFWGKYFSKKERNKLNENKSVGIK